jgi:hypothetical protein
MRHFGLRSATSRPIFKSSRLLSAIARPASESPALGSGTSRLGFGGAEPGRGHTIVEPLSVLAVCYASRINRIKIHESEFLYLANCHRTKGPRSPDNQDFLHEYANNPQVQQAARDRETLWLLP